VTLTKLVDLVAASGIVGTLLPILIALVNQEHWPPWTKGAVTATLAVIAGLITAWGAGSFDGASPLVSVVVVLLTASGAFQSFWKPTRFADFIETTTTFASRKIPTSRGH
jgi:hypothetical protein